MATRYVFFFDEMPKLAIGNSWEGTSAFINFDEGNAVAIAETLDGARAQLSMPYGSPFRGKARQALKLNPVDPDYSGPLA